MIKITIEIPVGEPLPPEILQLLNRINDTQEKSSSVASHASVQDGENAHDEVSDAQLAFAQNLVGKGTRLSVANGQKAVIKALIDVPWEQGLTRDEFLSRTGRSNRAMSGLLGAFGKRVAGTSGFEAVQDGQLPLNAILYTKKEGAWCYRLKPWFRKALNVLYEDGQLQWLHDDKSY